MSLFRVNLNSSGQGLLDINPTSGNQFAVSLQRTIYVTGPNHSNRKLMDGDEFTGSNYWKKFAYPQVPLNEAFIEVVEDDGSVYSNIPSENTFPKVYNVNIAPDSNYSDNIIDISLLESGHAAFVQINNKSSIDIKIKINGSNSAIFDLASAESQVFNSGDLSVNKLEFISVSAGQETAVVQIIASIRSDLNS